MSLATIMVDAGLGPDSADRVRLAADLADRFGSRLIGIAARQLVVPMVTDAVSGTIVGGESAHDAEADIRSAEVQFRKAAGTNGTIEWRGAIEQPNHYLVEQSRAADLIVLGRRGAGDLTNGAFAAGAGDVAMNAGRPILVAPPGTDYLSARRVVIGWKNTREARRAVRDSLPFLKAAQDVYVTAFGPEANDADLRDVRGYLKLHGVEARVISRNGVDTDVSDAIMEVASGHNADLIVAGAYGHSRMREWIFGGVTHDLLDRAPVCCLMAH
jgi:nucleotide-binding universal stress UspA family protein